MGKTLLEDLHRGDFQRTIHRDLQDVYQFYLDDATRAELAQMSQFHRWVYVTFWLVKSSILKLNPTRRAVLLCSVLFFLHSVITNNPVSLVLSFAPLMLILLLELKDKLLAQDELETGRAVQFALMPKDNPVLPGWETWLFTRSANEVGGDLVDYLQVRENRLGIALGDVAGKGLGAALVMAKLQATLRAIAPDFGHLSDLGAATNRIFCRDSLPSRFVSLVYLELEPASGRVRLINAGHLPPIVVGADAVRELPKGSAALGLLEGVGYQEQSVALAPGEFLLVYSDGLTEARNEGGGFFGQQRLLRLLPRLRGLSADAAGQCLLDEVELFIGDARPSDDLSIVLLKRCGPSSQPVASPPGRHSDVRHVAST